LTGEIAAAERAIDALVYAAFDLTSDEIALVEATVSRRARMACSWQD
ncbi:MAG: hypothetical protein JO048_17305, partial [Methylobacteriaceae bacterium]|nr:hypothetical protein [Methylobacteriaceae bacterium]